MEIVIPWHQPSRVANMNVEQSIDFERTRDTPHGSPDSTLDINTESSLSRRKLLSGSFVMIPRTFRARWLQNLSWPFVILMGLALDKEARGSMDVIIRTPSRVQSYIYFPDTQITG